MGFLVTPIVFLYPTTKRFFPYPQAVLGSCFNTGVFFGFGVSAIAAASQLNFMSVLPFYVGGVAWTVFYDTVYAFPDRDFDRKLKLRSCALEFESNP